MTFDEDEQTRVATLRLTFRDVALAGLCVRGACQWLEQHGFDWRDALRNGLSAQDVLARGDAHGQQVVKRALNRGR